MDEIALGGKGRRLPPTHASRLVPVEWVEVDPILWDSVRRLAPDEAERLPAWCEVPTYPVLERNGRLILLAFFSSFVEARRAGTRFVQVWTAELDPTDSVLEMAVAMAVVCGR